jgi:hypothetical protein
MSLNGHLGTGSLFNNSFKAHSFSLLALGLHFEGGGNHRRNLLAADSNILLDRMG